MDFEPSRLKRRRNEHWGVEPDPELEDQLEDVTGAYEVVNRRRILWRDSAFILIGVVVALLLAQILLPSDGGTGSGKPTELPTGAVLGLTSAPRTLAPGDTFGPILDPNLGIDATPTPIPLITLGPTRRPTPTPSAAPGATPAPTPRITPAPTPRPPTAPPTQAPTPVVTPPPPPPTVAISCEVPALSSTVTCSSVSTDIEANSQVWDPGGTGTLDGGGTTTGSLVWTYDTPGVYTVRLTVTGDDGSTASDQATVTVPGL